MSFFTKGRYFNLSYQEICFNDLWKCNCFLSLKFFFESNGELFSSLKYQYDNAVHPSIWRLVLFESNIISNITFLGKIGSHTSTVDKI
jgi:hypothetical protein